MLVEERCIVEAMDAYLRAWGAGDTRHLQPRRRRSATPGPLASARRGRGGAGAAALACARDLVRARPEVRRVVVVASGANADPVLRA